MYRRAAARGPPEGDEDQAARDAEAARLGERQPEGAEGSALSARR